MAFVVTHAKVSGIADDPSAAAAGEVVPSDWNADHVIAGQADQTQLPTVTIRKPASSATVTVLSSDIEVGIDTRSTAVTVTLPGASAWATANPFGLELVIYDYYGNAGTNSIAFSLAGGDSFAGAWGTSPPVISADSGILRLRPDASLPGWVVRGVN